MKLFKKNQVIIYIIVLMLMTAGYMNYTTNTENQSLETSLKMKSDDMQIAAIGDATLVNSNDVLEEEEDLEKNESTTNNVKNISNDVSEDSNNDDNNISNNTIKTIETAAKIDEYFIKSKLERDTMYSQMIESYEKILNSTNSLETQKQIATQEITKINEIKNKIMISENLIATKNFEKCVIFVNGESISVIIGAEELKAEEIAQIQNIITREINAEIENISISMK